jgi:thiamine pyrophosphate-dependent acetolactate synthase large subunit-like protein
MRRSSINAIGQSARPAARRGEGPEKRSSESFLPRTPACWALPDFVKLAEAFGCKGILCSDPADLDDAIAEMLAYDGPVIFDCVVEKHENCFPMIPSGEPHNKMLLGDDKTRDAIQKGGAVLV